MTDELAVGKERLRNEIEEVRSRISGHKKLAAQLELSLFELRARPRPFGELSLPTQEQIKLSSAEKFRLRNAAEISHQKLGKFVGIRVCDYKHEPQSFVVELTVTKNRGTLADPYYVAFKQKPDGSYRVLKSQMPHMIIISETQRNFPLENERQLGEFVRELRVCCQSYQDRKDQVDEFMSVRNMKMIPTVSIDEGYLFLQLGVMLDNVGGKLGILYRHNRIFPHKFTLTLKDTNAHRTWSESLKLLYKCSLVEALSLLTVKESPPDSEHETDTPTENGTTEKSQKSRKTIASPRKQSLSQSVKNAKKSPPGFSFNDSSSDEANRSGRMRKKRAKIASNIRRKTYWGALHQQASQEANESEKSSGTSVVDSVASQETVPVKSGKKPKEMKSRKRVGGKQSREVTSKIRRLATPPPVSDSELSDNESVPNPAKSAKKLTLAPLFRKSSAAKGSVRKTSAAPAASPSSQIAGKQTLLAAVFHKARKSLLESDQDESTPTLKEAANTRQELTKPSEKPSESSSSSAAQGNKGKSLKTSKETENENSQSPPKNSQSSQGTKVSSDLSATFHEEHNSDTVLSESRSVVMPRKLTNLKSSSQESEVGGSRWGSMETVARDPQSTKEVRVVKAAQVLLPRIPEDELMQLSPHKRSASAVAVGREQSPSREKRSVRSPQKKSGGRDSGSGVGSSEGGRGGRKGRIQDDNLVGRSPLEKDNDQDMESGVGSKRGGRKTSSDVTQGGRKGRIQDEDLVRRSSRKKGNDQDVESGVGSKRGGRKTSSDVVQGGRKGRIQDEDLVRGSPRKKGNDQDTESGVGLKKGGRKTPSEVAQGGRKGRIQNDLVRKSPRKLELK